MTPRMTNDETRPRSANAGARPLSFLTLALCLACGGGSGRSTTPPPPTPAFTQTLVLRGPEAARVAIAEFGADEAYVRLEGVPSPRAGYTFKATVNRNGDRTTYETRWDGRPYFPVHRNARRGGDPTWTLYGEGLPRDGMSLAYDEEASAALDGTALHVEHHVQSEDGTLAAVQEFDRAAAEAYVREELGGDAARVGEACGMTPEVDVRFDTMDDTLWTEERISVAGYCANVLDALRNVCRDEPARELVQAGVQRVSCAWGQGEAWGLELAEGTLVFTAARTSNLQQKAREALLAMETAPGVSLEDAVVMARTDVCVEGDHVVAVYPNAFSSKPAIGYGTRARLTRTPQNEYLGDGWFYDPRQWAEGHNASFRGMDMRLHSRVEVDRDGGTCAVVCGERRSEWELLSTSDATALLEAAETAPPAFDRRPYALARDGRGVYFYVDTGNTEATARDFRVYRGPRGNLERLQMRDVASDSGGEIFSTARGDLRLIVDQDEAQWIRGRRPQRLRKLNVEENLRMIFTELGVYLGLALELPCDDY